MEGSEERGHRQWILNWLTAAVLLSSLSGLWALASPIYSAPDEPAHTYRAASLARGQLIGERVRDAPHGANRLVYVPGGLLVLFDYECFFHQPNQPASCASPPSTFLRQTVPTLSAAGAYPPLYYLLVGLPVAIEGTARAFYASRILTGLFSSVLLAAAFASAMSLRARSFLSLGTALAVTPMVLYVTATINPSSLEIAAAICLWVNGIIVLDRMPSPLNERLPLGLVGVSGAVLALSRPISALWLGIIVLSLMALSTRQRLVQLLGSAPGRFWLAVVVVAVLISGAWMLAFDPAAPNVDIVPDNQLKLTESLEASLGRTPYNLAQMIGNFGWLDAPIPSPMVWLWFALVGALLFVAVGSGQPAIQWNLFAIFVITAFLPPIVEALEFNDRNVFWQGRYILPVAVGLPVLAGHAVDSLPDSLRALLQPSRAIGLFGTFLAHNVAYFFALRRFVVGTGGDLRFFGHPAGWQPPLPDWVLALMFLALSAAWLIWMLEVRSGRNRRKGWIRRRS